jgi:hypothetical protein
MVDMKTQQVERHQTENDWKKRIDALSPEKRKIVLTEWFRQIRQGLECGSSNSSLADEIVRGMLQRPSGNPRHE